VSETSTFRVKSMSAELMRRVRSRMKSAVTAFTTGRWAASTDDVSREKNRSTTDVKRQRDAAQVRPVSSSATWRRHANVDCCNSNQHLVTIICPHTHTRLMALCAGLPGWAGTRKVKPVWILLKQETVSGSGISWAICWMVGVEFNAPLDTI